MKFYEINEPYYALIRAKDDADATNEYINTVAGNEGEFDVIHRQMNAVDKEHVKVKVRGLIGNINLIDEDLAQEQIRRFTEGKQTEVILLDGSLI